VKSDGTGKEGSMRREEVGVSTLDVKRPEYVQENGRESQKKEGSNRVDFRNRRMF